MHKDYDPAEQLAAAAGRVCAGDSVESIRRTAMYAYLQSTITTADVQAIINLLISKNILSREQIDRALNDARLSRYEQLSGSSKAVLMQAPTTKSQ